MSLIFMAQGWNMLLAYVPKEWSILFILMSEVILHSQPHLIINPQDDSSKNYSATNDDVIDRDMDQFHKEANESHYGKSYCCCHGNLLEFFSIRLGASFN